MQYILFKTERTMAYGHMIPTSEKRKDIKSQKCVPLGNLGSPTSSRCVSHLGPRILRAFTAMKRSHHIIAAISVTENGN